MNDRIKELEDRVKHLENVCAENFIDPDPIPYVPDPNRVITPAEKMLTGIYGPIVEAQLTSHLALFKINTL